MEASIAHFQCTTPLDFKGQFLYNRAVLPCLTQSATKIYFNRGKKARGMAHWVCQHGASLRSTKVRKKLRELFLDSVRVDTQKIPSLFFSPLEQFLWDESSIS